MQASSHAVAGVAPAAFVGMLRSRLIPAFLCVALAHLALLAIFVAPSHAPVPRALESTAIVAQLLHPPTEAPAVAVQSAPEPSPKRAHAEPDRPRASPPPPRIARPRTLPAPTAAAAPSPPPAQASAQPSLPDKSAPAAPSAATQTAAGTSNPASAAPSSPGAPGARQTIAITAPKHVDHADCRIVKPAYPELSKRRGETGTATVRFVIGTTGAIDTVALVKSSGFARLDDAALQALRESACQPYLEDGAPIRASYVQAFTFGLDDD
ncbi:energy transducer TonB [Trinickia sp.]|uniref:energy transducer TonB n=1 Tax=Trinickia sp. TaxID=2571163 RepID=UPI003F81966E